MGKSLLLYTGGTFGMMPSEPGNSDSPLVPSTWEQVTAFTPGLSPMLDGVDVRSLTGIDSSDMTPAYWLEIARAIRDAYDAYDGFVILHGTDTMAYTASALSFLFANLAKPVVLTGANGPVWHETSDGFRNLDFALEVACPDRSGLPLVPEVTICFGGLLLRGNRARKLSLSASDAFQSPNYPPLGRTERVPLIDVSLLCLPNPDVFHIQERMGEGVVLLDVFPGMSEDFLEYTLASPGLSAVVLRTFGSGNVPTSPRLLDCIADACSRGVIVANITQCMEGGVVMERYAGGAALHSLGVISGGDMTPEAALTKLQVLLGRQDSTETVKGLFEENLRGERSF